MNFETPRQTALSEAGSFLVHSIKRQEVAVVMPCLNEARTLASCIIQAQRTLDSLNLRGEIVVADNNSADSSEQIAQNLGAKVVRVGARGYGNALRAGIEAANAEYVIMGDCDESYDFTAIGVFIEQLKQGHDLVIGNRFLGGIMPGAMPWKHRWIGNPMLSALFRVLFQTPIGDINCGLRAFRKDAFDRMELSANGMEFASEMVAKASLLRMKITEVPTTLRKDGRAGPSHLRWWRDGWRHLRLILHLGLWNRLTSLFWTQSARIRAIVRPTMQELSR